MTIVYLDDGSHTDIKIVINRNTQFYETELNLIIRRLQSEILRTTP